MKKSKIFISTIPTYAIVEVNGEQKKCSLLHGTSPDPWSVKVGDIVTVSLDWCYKDNDIVNARSKAEESPYACYYKTLRDGAKVLEIIHAPDKDDKNWVKFPTSIDITEPTPWHIAKDWYVIVLLSFQCSKAWKRAGKNSYYNLITLEEFSQLDTGRRILQEELPIYKSRRDALKEMYG